MHALAQRSKHGSHPASHVMSVKWLETEGTSDKLLIRLCQGFHARFDEPAAPDLHASNYRVHLSAGGPVTEVPGGRSVANHAHLARHWGHAWNTEAGHMAPPRTSSVETYRSATHTHDFGKPRHAVQRTTSLKQGRL